MTADYRVKVTVRNARIMRALESIGHNPSSFARAYGFYAKETCAIAALRIKPVLANGNWRASVMKLCEITGKMPSELFTDRQMNGLRANSSERDVGEDAIVAMLEPPASPEQLAITSDMARIANEVIDGISPRAATAFRLHADGATYEEIGAEIGGVSRERARQLVMKAQRHVRERLANRGIKSLAEAS
jgi:hypothetical protein